MHRDKTPELMVGELDEIISPAIKSTQKRNIDSKLQYMPTIEILPAEPIAELNSSKDKD